MFERSRIELCTRVLVQPVLPAGSRHCLCPVLLAYVAVTGAQTTRMNQTLPLTVPGRQGEQVYDEDGRDRTPKPLGGGSHAAGGGGGRPVPPLGTMPPRESTVSFWGETTSRSVMGPDSGRRSSTASHCALFTWAVELWTKVGIVIGHKPQAFREARNEDGQLCFSPAVLKFCPHQKGGWLAAHWYRSRAIKA